MSGTITHDCQKLRFKRYYMFEIRHEKGHVRKTQALDHSKWLRSLKESIAAIKGKGRKNYQTANATKGDFAQQSR